MSGPQSPEEYGEGMDDTELEAAGWAAGLDVWGPVEKSYGNDLGDGTLANSQLWSLRQAVRVQALAEVRALADGWDEQADGPDAADFLVRLYPLLGVEVPS